MKFKFNIQPKVSLKEQILFARNLSLMSQTGIPLLEGLKMLENQTQSKTMKKILASLSQDVENGQFMATSLRKHEGTFGPLFINIIHIGETSGTLAENLNFLADELKKKRELRAKITSALVYPIIILITTFMLVGVLMFFILPRILPIFDSFNSPLPLPTRILIGTNKFFLNHWFSALITVVVLGVGIAFLRTIRQVREATDRVVLTIPLVGQLTKTVHMAIFSRTFALLLKSGVKIVEALGIASDILPNSTYQKILHAGGEKVRIGEPLGKYLMQYPNLFPLMFSQMIEVSESSGTMDETLLYLSTYYENELDDTTRNLVSFLEPLLMVVMGGLVGFIAISILLPIYSLSQTFAQ